MPSGNENFSNFFLTKTNSIIIMTFTILFILIYYYTYLFYIGFVCSNSKEGLLNYRQPYI